MPRLDSQLASLAGRFVAAAPTACHPLTGGQSGDIVLRVRFADHPDVVLRGSRRPPRGVVHRVLPAIGRGCDDESRPAGFRIACPIAPHGLRLGGESFVRDVGGTHWTAEPFLSGAATLAERPASLPGVLSAMAKLHASLAVVRPSGEQPVEPLQSRLRFAMAQRDTHPLVPVICRELTAFAQSERSAEAFADPQFIWRDPWAANILLDDGKPPAFIDPHQLCLGPVAIDLARLLGSLPPFDAALRQAALDAYERVRPLRAIDHELIRLLERSGIVLAWARWMGRPSHPEKAIRLEQLQARIDSLSIM